MDVDLKQLREKVEKITTPGEIENLIVCDTPYRRFAQTAEQYPDLTAVKYMGSDITYTELLRLADIMAKGFAALGVKKNDVVTVS